MNSTATTVGVLAPVEYDPFAEAPLARVVPTTEPQREVWLADSLGGNASLAYNESVSMQFDGALNLDALRFALQELTQRHESLRATVSENGEELHIAESISLGIPTDDLSTLDAAAQIAAIAMAKRRVVETCFDLVRGPLFRAEILALTADKHLLLLTAHHIVCDGWSFGILVRELCKMYAQTAHGENDVAAALSPPASFADYAVSRVAASSSQDGADERFWVAQFADSIPILDLPTDRARAAQRTFASLREDYTLPATLVADLRKLGARNGASLFATLLAGFAALLNRISGSDNFAIGIPAAGQSSEGYANLVGHCVNLLPLRMPIAPTVSMQDLLKHTQTTMLDAYEHQEYTFGTLLKKLSIERDPARLPLVSVLFNIDQALDTRELGLSNLVVDFKSNARSFENFEQFINAVQEHGTLRLECQFNADLFDLATVRRWLTCYEALLQNAVRSPGAALGNLPIIGGTDLVTLARWNDTAAPYDDKALVHTLFEAQVRKNPDAPAIMWQGNTTTYAELDRRANALAHSLRERGVGAGALVGLHLERGVDLVACLLGVMKSGAGYVPLDPAYPADRLAYMASDANLAMLLTQSTIDSPIPWPAEKIIVVDAITLAGVALARAATLPSVNDIAYVIYTSGSTGKPKGVSVPHGAVVNFLQSMARTPGLDASDRLVAVTTLSFDIAVNELLLPLSVGAQIILASRDEAIDGVALGKLLAANRATVMQATPATWRLLLDAGWNGGRTFKALCGGEALGTDLAEALIARAGELWNMYGPTETTVWSTCSNVTNLRNGISIGQPIANTTVHVLNESLQVCPIGVPGEIFIGGDGVTLGYLSRPELTAERFIPDPFSTKAGARMYRTGDRGRWRSDGNLEHLGRLDFQVKVRGYRIELGEIENALATYPAIAQAVVIAREDRPGDVRLVAYLVAKPGMALEKSALRNHLKSTLPDYMIPGHFLVLATIPLLPNGKINRRTLPAPDQPVAATANYVAPRNELEKIVAAEMEASLGMPGVSVHEDFFVLGGHSLLAAQLTSRLNRRFNVGLSMQSVFEAPTIERLAALIQNRTTAPSSAASRTIAHRADQSRAPLSIMQERLWFLEEFYPGQVAYHAPSAHRLEGVLDEAAFARAFAEIIRRQPSLRTWFARDGANIVQVIDDAVDVALFPAEDLSAIPADSQGKMLLMRLEQLTAETFEFTQAPLFKARMFRLSPTDHVLFFMPHHIIWDGWSFDLFYDEMSALYAAFSSGKANPLAELTVTYGDFASWQRQWESSPEFAQKVEFWRGRLQRMGQPRELPTDKPRAPGMSSEGDTEWIVIDAARTEALHRISQGAGTTLFNTLLAAYSILLYAYARQTNMVIGTPVRCRNSVELEPIMGYFVNLLPLQYEIAPEETFGQFIQRVKSAVVEGFAHPDVPLEQLSRELSVMRGQDGSIFYQAFFSFQDARQRITTWGDLQHRFIPLYQRGAVADLGMWFLESAAGLQGGITYRTGLYTKETIAWLHTRYLSLLDQVIAAPSSTVASLAGAADPERRLIHAAPPPILAQKELAGSSTRTTAPQTATEKLLAAIWCEQLKIRQVALEDNFFDLGGHSLLAMQAIVAMEAKIGKRINPNRFIFETLGQVARAYDEASVEEAAKPGKVRRLLSRLIGSKTT